MMIRPTPLTAGLAGAFSAVVWPWLTDRFGGASEISLEWILATLAVVALPAHACVVGMVRPQPDPSAPAGAPPGGRAGVDKALLTRVAAWIGGAGVALGIGALF